MTDPLDSSMRAWAEALAGMRTTKPTYKASLIVAILELLESGAAQIPSACASHTRFAVVGPVSRND